MVAFTSLLPFSIELFGAWSNPSLIATLDPSVIRINISPDGTEFLAVAQSGALVETPNGAAIIELATGKSRNWIRKGDPSFLDAVSSPSGKYIVTLEVAGSEGIKFLNRTRLDIESTFDKTAGWFHRLKISADGHWIGAISGTSNAVYVWNVARRTERVLASQDEVSDFAFASGREELFVVGRHSGVDVWDLATGQQLKSLEADKTHWGRLSCSNDGSMLARFSGFGGLHLFDLSSQQPIAKDILNGSLYDPECLEFMQDDRYLIATGDRRRPWLALQTGFPFVVVQQKAVPYVLACDTSTWKVFRRWNLEECVSRVLPISNTKDFITIDAKGRVHRWRIE